MNKFLRNAFALIFSVLAAGCQSPDPRLVNKAQLELAKARDAFAAAQGAISKGNWQTAQQRRTASETHYGKAVDYFRAANAETTKDIGLLRDYAEALTRTANHDLAAEVWRRAAVIRPRDAEIRLKLGQSLAALGDFAPNDAVNALRKAAELDPESELAAEAFETLGKLYQDQGLYEFAEESYADALRIAPNRGVARIGAAALDARYGRMAKAADAIDAMTDLPPDLGFQLPGIIAEALHGFEQARRQFPDEAAQHVAYAKLLLRANRFADARWPLERAVALEPNDYVSWNFLASVARQINNTERAREAYSRSLEIRPDQPRTQAALEQLDQFEQPS